MNLPDFLTQHADGDIRLTGHRIGLYSVVRGEPVDGAFGPARSGRDCRAAGDNRHGSCLAAAARLSRLRELRRLPDRVP